MKLDVYVPTPQLAEEKEAVCTLGLSLRANGDITLDVVNSDTGVRLPSGTIMRFYQNDGEIKYRPATGCYQGGIDDKIKLAS